MYQIRSKKYTNQTQIIGYKTPPLSDLQPATPPKKQPPRRFHVRGGCDFYKRCSTKFLANSSSSSLMV
jgi:hypothetical protein